MPSLKSLNISSWFSCIYLGDKARCDDGLISLRLLLLFLLFFLGLGYLGDEDVRRSRLTLLVLGDELVVTLVDFSRLLDLQLNSVLALRRRKILLRLTIEAIKWPRAAWEWITNFNIGNFNGWMCYIHRTYIWNTLYYIGILLRRTEEVSNLLFYLIILIFKTIYHDLLLAKKKNGNVNGL